MSADEKIDEQEIEDAFDAFGDSFPQVLTLEKLLKARGRSFTHAMIVFKFKQLQDWWEEWYEIEVKDQIIYRRSVICLLLLQTVILMLVLWRVW